MRIVFCGGGTAGHVHPALAISEMIAERYKGAEAVFFGRKGGDENSAITKSGYPLIELEVEGLARRHPIRSVRAVSLAWRARSEARELLREICPSAVIGTGGYVSWPVLSAAISLGIPALIHESNASPGLVTRLLGRRCNAVMLGFEAAEMRLGGAHTVYTGNPVRREIGRLGRREARRRLGIDYGIPLVLSFGGSLGAERMNAAVLEAVGRSVALPRGTLWVHATGRRHFESVKAVAGKNTDKGCLRILPYIEDMPLWLAAADIGVTRGGAMTLAELCAARLPAIIIPSPNVTDDHQTKNAEALAEAGAVRLLAESELSGDRLLCEVSPLLSDGGKRAAMAAAYPDGSPGKTRERIMGVIDEFCRE
ncbi:MAG: UDP-N-acetylglucosamine--N-acetylmuramyl-(pentapeptide) pyrophosphoryl-undecaprenol N-acetylglucosamine transferase [Clostridia bacterium]|nr:UDP-N-acetylglucosamine--N-acetylmuramyl-(pentapeptide) pyrophosphoryl-undecaprenol N-acetylglucosamine transferase [Clostridia bacterium]